MARGAGRIAGVDEVGVAPTCGAVVAAAVIMPTNCRRNPGIRDSKTLSAAQRERLAPIIRRRAIAVGLGAASVADIDPLENIYHATHLAMRRAIARLGGHDHVLVDGLRIADFEAQVGPSQAIVDGDARVYSIACASVVAKVGARPGMIRDLGRHSPEYGWERNAGYATRTVTRSARTGSRPAARKSWQALQVLMAGDQLGLFDADEAVVDSSATTSPGSTCPRRRCSPCRWATSKPPKRSRRADRPARERACASSAISYPAGPAQRAGAAVERMVALRLIGEGWRILAANLRLGRDEFDLVAIDPGPPPMLVVVEVRSPGAGTTGSPRRPSTTASGWRCGARSAHCSTPARCPTARRSRLPLRLDLVAVD